MKKKSILYYVLTFLFVFSVLLLPGCGFSFGDPSQTPGSGTTPPQSEGSGSGSGEGSGSGSSAVVETLTPQQYNLLITEGEVFNNSHWSGYNTIGQMNNGNQALITRVKYNKTTKEALKEEYLNTTFLEGAYQFDGKTFDKVVDDETTYNACFEELFAIGDDYSNAEEDYYDFIKFGSVVSTKTTTEENITYNFVSEYPMAIGSELMVTAEVEIVCDMEDKMESYSYNYYIDDVLFTTVMCMDSAATIEQPSWFSYGNYTNVEASDDFMLGFLEDTDLHTELANLNHWSGVMAIDLRSLTNSAIIMASKESNNFSMTAVSDEKVIEDYVVGNGTTYSKEYFVSNPDKIAYRKYPAGYVNTSEQISVIIEACEDFASASWDMSSIGENEDLTMLVSWEDDGSYIYKIVNNDTELFKQWVFDADGKLQGYSAQTGENKAVMFANYTEALEAPEGFDLANYETRTLSTAEMNDVMDSGLLFDTSSWGGCSYSEEYDGESFTSVYDKTHGRKVDVEVVGSETTYQYYNGETVYTKYLLSSSATPRFAKETNESWDDNIQFIPLDMLDVLEDLTLLYFRVSAYDVKDDTITYSLLAEKGSELHEFVWTLEYNGAEQDILKSIEYKVVVGGICDSEISIQDHTSEVFAPSWFVAADYENRVLSAAEVESLLNSNVLTNTDHWSGFEGFAQFFTDGVQDRESLIQYSKASQTQREIDYDNGEYYYTGNHEYRVYYGSDDTRHYYHNIEEDWYKDYVVELFNQIPFSSFEKTPLNLEGYYSYVSRVVVDIEGVEASFDVEFLMNSDNQLVNLRVVLIRNNQSQVMTFTDYTGTIEEPEWLNACKYSVGLKVITEAAEEITNVGHKLTEIINSKANEAVALGSNGSNQWIAVEERQMLWDIDTPMMFVYISEYIMKNAVVNGLTEGLVLDKVYYGDIDFGYAGVIYCSINLVDEGISLMGDFYFTEQGMNLQYSFTALFGYDFENDKLTSIAVNYAILPIAMEFSSVVINLETGDVYSVFISDPANMSLTLGVEFAQAFNAGNLTLEELMEFGFTYVRLIKVKLAEDISDCEFEGYRYDTVDGYVVSSEEVEELFNDIYANVKGFKFRDGINDNLEKIETDELTYLQKAADYGQNKSDYVSVSNINNKWVYEFVFVEYDEMLRILNKAYADLSEDDTVDELVLEMLSSMIAELEEQNADTYTGNFYANRGYTIYVVFGLYREYESDEIYNTILINTNDGRSLYIRYDDNETIYHHGIVTWGEISGAILECIDQMENYATPSPEVIAECQTILNMVNEKPVLERVKDSVLSEDYELLCETKGGQYSYYYIDLSLPNSDGYLEIVVHLTTHDAGLYISASYYFNN